MFDKLCIEKIYNEGKWQTRRRYNPSRRPAIPGSIHKLKIDRTKNVYGYIEINNVYSQRFGDISEFDAQAEGFNSVEEYKDYFQSINGEHNPDDMIWVVCFRRMWGMMPNIEQVWKMPEEWGLD